MDPEEKNNLITTLNDLQNSIEKGDLGNIKQTINSFHQNLARNKQLLSEVYTSNTKCVTNTDLVIAACVHKQADILYYLLNKTDILDYLTDASFDVTEVNKQKTKAFQCALRSDAFCMVEMLYDYWCGDLHWMGHDINTLRTMGKLLEDARVACLECNQPLLVNFHSLIKFNEFQQKLYSSVPKQGKTDTTPKQMGAMLLYVLCIYDQYSDLEKIRIPHQVHEKELELIANYEDTSSVYYKGLTYVMYEVYFRKLDYNISLLILENLNLLRTHLIDRFNKSQSFFTNNPELRIRYEHAASSFEQIECAIYHFIYRVDEDWRLYLPGNRRLTTEKHTGIHAGRIIKNLKITYDIHKLFNGSVIYFERKRFKKCLNKLKKILKRHIISRDPALLGTQNQTSRDFTPIQTVLDDNHLKPMMYMSDHYSLSKIVGYIEAIENTNDINILMIERVLQVIGEMTKSTDKSHHLSHSTEALLQIAISVETTKHIHNMREFLSHVDYGQLSIRIHNSTNQQAQTFDDIKRDLKIIKQVIHSILDIYTGILDKSVLEKGLRLLNNRIENLPPEAVPHINNIYSQYKIHKSELFLQSSVFVQEVWTHTGLSIQLLKEIAWILGNKEQILSKIQIAETLIDNNVISILPRYIDNIRRTLQLITETNKNVNLYNQLPKGRLKNLPDCPEQVDINDRQGKAKSKKYGVRGENLKAVLELLDKIKDLSIHWKPIKHMLAFCLDDCKIFASIRHLKREDGNLDMQTVSNAYTIIAELEAICVMHTSTLARVSGRSLVLWGLWIYGLYKNWMGLRLFEEHSFSGIEKLRLVARPNKSSKEELMLCLKNRMDLLKDTLDYKPTIPMSQYIQRFKHDDKYRLMLEMLIGDIANVLVECKIRKTGKSGKMLRGIDMGNVIDHGNVFLEVIGNVYDSQDVPEELLKLAIMFAEDGKSIGALHELFLDNINYNIFKNGDIDNMTDRQKILYDRFKTSQNWESYKKMFPYRN